MLNTTVAAVLHSAMMSICDIVKKFEGYEYPGGATTVAQEVIKAKKL